MKGIAAAILVLMVGMGTARAAEPLVGPDWVKAQAGAAGTVFLDIRPGGRAEYLAGHVPGAVYSDYADAGWVDGHGRLPTLPALERLIGGLGIDQHRHVVVIARGTDATDMGAATRVYWTLKVAGLGEVSVLDGGMAAYERDRAAPVEAGERITVAVPFKAVLHGDLLATKADVVRALGEGYALVDDRPLDQHLGINRSPSVARPGTLPGARAVPENWLTVDDGGRFRNRQALARIFANAGIAPQTPQIEFCSTGHWASLGWFVAHELLGNPHARLYDGSMAEWAADGSLPVERKLSFE